MSYYPTVRVRGGGILDSIAFGAFLTVCGAFFTTGETLEEADDMCEGDCIASGVRVWRLSKTPEWSVKC